GSPITATAPAAITQWHLRAGGGAVHSISSGHHPAGLGEEGRMSSRRSEASLRSVEDLKSEQTIDAPHIVFALEFDDPLLAFLLGTLQQHVSRLHEVVERHTKATGILDARKTYADDGAHPEIKRKGFVELVELGIVRLQHLPPTIEPENEGGSPRRRRT